jgi:hypothetical protein
MPEKRFFIRVRGAVQGPFSLEQLRAMHARGQFRRFHEVSEDRQTWAAASSLAELFPAPAPSGRAAVADVTAAALPAAPAGAEPLAAQPAVWFFVGPSGGGEGPVPREQLLELMRRGVVQQTTLVWREGLSEWVPLSAPEAGVLAPPVRRAAPPAAAVAPAPVAFYPDDDPVAVLAEPARGPGFGYQPVGVLVLLHFITLGIYSTVWLNLLHGKLPKVRHDDPSAAKALGFLFIPFFNLYWVFFTYHRLAVRVNEQSARAGLADQVSTGLAVTNCVLMVIPCLGLVSFLILMPLFAASVQSAVNELAGGGGDW